MSRDASALVLGSVMDPAPDPVRRVAEVAPARAVECIELERVELARLLLALDALSPDQWELAGRGGRSIRYGVAMLVGTYAAQARVSQAWRQLDPRLLHAFRFPGEPLHATVARARAGQRLGASPAALLAELRIAGERALQRRALVARASAALPSLVPEPAGLIAWPAHPFSAVRDLWYRRLDVAETTGAGFALSPAHDGRVIELLLREGADRGSEPLNNAGVDLRLEPDGPVWRFGAEGEPAARVAVSVVTLARLLDGSRSAEATRERSDVRGDARTTTLLLRALHGAARR